MLYVLIRPSFVRLEVFYDSSPYHTKTPPAAVYIDFVVVVERLCDFLNFAFMSLTYLDYRVKRVNKTYF